MLPIAAAVGGGQDSASRPPRIRPFIVNPASPRLDPPDGPRHLCTIAANFTAEPVGESLAYWNRELQFGAGLQFAPFDQIIQLLISRSSAPAHRSEFVVVLVQCERWILSAREQDPAAVTGRFDALCDAVLAAAGLGTMRLVVLICPASPAARGHPAVRAAEQRMHDRLNGAAGVDFTTSAQIQLLYPPERYEAQFDDFANRQAQAPYSRLGFATLGTMIARRLHQYCVPPRKVIVVDCDNTLWSGLAAEDGLNVAVCSVRRELQALLAAQSEAGRLVCLCSKNDPADVLNILDRHEGMVLRRTHLTAWRINWDPKPANLRALAAELSLHPGSFIFIDDDRFECAAMRALCPEVLTLELPADRGEIPAFLRGVWELDLRPPTDEDRMRTRFYQQDAARKREQQRVASLSEFLSSLGLNVGFRPVAAEDLPRAVQLLERTNQFNLNGRRCSAAELGRWAERADYALMLVDASDRFGDYGDVGLLICRMDAATLRVESLALSCRALGRGVEGRVAAQIKRIAEARGARSVAFDYQPTARNQPVGAFLAECGVGGHDGGRMVRAAEWLAPSSSAPQPAAPLER